MLKYPIVVSRWANRTSRMFRTSIYETLKTQTRDTNLPTRSEYAVFFIVVIGCFLKFDIGTPIAIFIRKRLVWGDQ
jgi:hypothetical protein